MNDLSSAMMQVVNLHNNLLKENKDLKARLKIFHQTIMHVLGEDVGGNECKDILRALVSDKNGIENEKT